MVVTGGDGDYATIQSDYAHRGSFAHRRPITQLAGVVEPQTLDATRRAQGTGVLPAGGDAMESAEMAVAFAAIGADRMIGTRLDIARRLGGILSATQAGNLALMAVSTSPNIGTALLPINPVSLARLLLPRPAEPTATFLARETG